MVLHKKTPSKIITHHRALISGEEKVKAKAKIWEGFNLFSKTSLERLLLDKDKNQREKVKRKGKI
jgi:hypothetical protein